jgi:diaminohydroxyphosphoribosylaminopyrimidine deaminase/5-amino-6-(5-phosphoribosylamino)uracil reductase
MASEPEYMQLALRLARRGLGRTSPNPMVGAVLVERGRVLGRGWHHQAGEPHAEIEALHDAQRRGHSFGKGALYVTLEPCCTHGRTPPCTDAIIAAGIRRVVVGTIDPNPRHAGKGLAQLRRAGVDVTQGLLADECARLNEAFNHWIVHRRPFVTVKAGMTLDGKIATASGESKWITGPMARALGMRWRQSVDAILVGVNTVLADNPRLTARASRGLNALKRNRPLHRLVLDAQARTPADAKVLELSSEATTTIVVGRAAPKQRTQRLAKRARVLVAPSREGRIDLPWLLGRLGSEEITSLLVEGGGEVNASFLLGGLAQKVAFFYAPKILGGANSRKAVAGEGVTGLQDALQLVDVHWRRLGPDWLLSARINGKK